MLNIDKVTKKNVHECLLWLQFTKEKNDLERLQLEQLKNK